jgi:hypothetical protein
MFFNFIIENIMFLAACAQLASTHMVSKDDSNNARSLHTFYRVRKRHTSFSFEESRGDGDATVFGRNLTFPAGTFAPYFGFETTLKPLRILLPAIHD